MCRGAAIRDISKLKRCRSSGSQYPKPTCCLLRTNAGRRFTRRWRRHNLCLTRRHCVLLLLWICLLTVRRLLLLLLECWLLMLGRCEMVGCLWALTRHLFQLCLLDRLLGLLLLLLLLVVLHNWGIFIHNRQHGMWSLWWDLSMLMWRPPPSPGSGVRPCRDIVGVV